MADQNSFADPDEQKLVARLRRNKAAADRAATPLATDDPATQYPAYAAAQPQAAAELPMWGPFAPGWDQRRSAASATSPANAYAPVPAQAYVPSAAQGWPQRYAPAAAPAWGQYYAAPRGSDYATAPGYGYPVPATPAYPAAGWSGSPTRGTGGLY